MFRWECVYKKQCVYIATSKLVHAVRENSRKLCKPWTASGVCTTNPLVFRWRNTEEVLCCIRDSHNRPYSFSRFFLRLSVFFLAGTRKVFSDCLVAFLGVYEFCLLFCFVALSLNILDKPGRLKQKKPRSLVCGMVWRFATLHFQSIYLIKSK